VDNIVLTSDSFNSDKSPFEFDSLGLPDISRGDGSVVFGQNKRLWAWFLAQIYGKIEDDEIIPNSFSLFDNDGMYQPNNLFANDTVFVERIKTATATFEQKAKVYLAAQYGLKIVGEYYNMLKALKDKNTVAEIGVEEGKGGALVDLFNNMRAVIRTKDAGNLVGTVPMGVVWTIKDALEAHYITLNKTGAGDIISAGFCPAAALVKTPQNLATLKTLKIDGDVAKSTTEICKYSKLLQSTYTP